jgi:hypothetical protein
LLVATNLGTPVAIHCGWASVAVASADGNIYVVSTNAPMPVSTSHRIDLGASLGGITPIGPRAIFSVPATAPSWSTALPARSTTVRRRRDRLRKGPTSRAA